MHFLNTITSTLLLAGGAIATEGMPGTMTSSMSGGTMSAGTTTVHVITVSDTTGKMLKFSPNNVQAAMGDMVQFQFMGGNHTVTQATFAQPCVPINNVMSNTTGFFSGFQAVPMGATEMPTYTMMINSTSPIWFYCSQGKHCQTGMVGAINAAQSGAKTIEAFAALAANATENLAPGAPSSSGSTSSSGSNSTTPSGTGSGTGSSSTSVSSTVASAPPSTSSAPAISTGAASGSVWASSKELYMGGSLAGLVASFMMML